MTADRYVKLTLTVIAVALVAIAVQPWACERALPRAEALSGVAKFEVSLSKSWGKLVGYSNNNVLLEAADGSLRVVDVEGKPPEYPRVKVHMRWN